MASAPADPVKSGTEGISPAEGKPTAAEVPEDGKNGQIIKPTSLKFSLGEEKSNSIWKWEQSDDKRDVARLINVIWLEVKGEVEVDPAKKYDVRFRVSLSEDLNSSQWEKIPLYVMARRGDKREYAWKKVVLTVTGKDSERYIPRDEQGRGLVIDKVTTNPDNDDKRLYFGLYDIWSGQLKKGLAIHHASVREIP